MDSREMTRLGRHRVRSRDARVRRAVRRLHARASIASSASQRRAKQPRRRRRDRRQHRRLDHLGAAGPLPGRGTAVPREVLTHVRGQLAPAHRLHGGGRRRAPTPSASTWRRSTVTDGKAPGDRLFRAARATLIYQASAGVDPEARAALDDLRALAARRSASSPAWRCYAVQRRLQGHLPFNPDNRRRWSRSATCRSTPP